MADETKINQEFDWYRDPSFFRFNLADETKINHEFDWNKDPSFFTKQTTEVEEITLGPDLSWPLMTAPESKAVLKGHREKVQKISDSQKKAA